MHATTYAFELRDNDRDGVSSHRRILKRMYTIFDLL